MKLYINSYRMGDGYIMKSVSYPGENGIVEVSSAVMPEAERRLWNRKGALLFLGKPDGAVFGLIRNIETSIREDNNRECRINIAFEAEGDDALVRRLMWYAYEHKRSFDAHINSIVVYKDDDYIVNKLELNRLIEYAERSVSLNKQPDKAIELLVPEISKENFLYEMEFSDSCIDNDAVKTAPGIKDEDLNIFMYCSTPLMGYITRCIDPFTGLKIFRQRAAEEFLLPTASKLIYNAGVETALFKENDRICLVVNEIVSEKADQYGRKKRLSLIMDAPLKDERRLTMLEAWAVVDTAGFAKAVTDSIQIYYDVRGFEVNKSRLDAVLSQADMSPQWQEASIRKRYWNRIVNNRRSNPFRVISSTMDLDYISRSCCLKLSDESVGDMITDEELKALKTLKSADVKQKPEPDVKPEPNLGVKPESDPNVKQKPNPDVKQKPDPNVKPEPATEPEIIDLLKYKWFLPAAISGGIAVAVVITSIVKHFLK